ncbi:hypothetical protein C1X72_17255 [Pseudomonas sp. FW306-2-2C-D06B]|nr:hypothetical protein C1X72_17255 [Pseudomonas sp. FW306-2-2C-D06B]
MNSPTRACLCSEASYQACSITVGAGAPAKQTTRWMAPAMPVFAGAPAHNGRMRFMFAVRPWR